MAQMSITPRRRPVSNLPKQYRLVPLEMKHRTLLQAPSAVSLTPVITLLNGIGQGDNQEARDGILVTMKKLSIFCACVRADVTQQVRFIVFYDRQTNGALPLHADLMENTSTPLSHVRWANRQRFYVVADKLVTLDAAYRDSAVWKFAFDFPREIESARWLGASSAVTDCVSGSLFLFVQSDSGAVTHPTFSYSSRVEFIDA
jgi:hypothetical protein